MEGRIVRAFTRDNLCLQGMLCAPSSRVSNRRLVLHIHGSYGNFYENLFLDAMARAYVSAGLGFLAVNTRGHDYYADFKMKRKGGGYDSKRIGGILEQFEESVPDIRAWIDFAAGEGFGEVLLQGHSLGAMKAGFYAAQGKDERVKALFLVSPPDLLGPDIEQARARIEPNLVLARRLSAKNPDALMPEGSHFDPISAGAYISLYGDLNIAGMFSFGGSSASPSRSPDNPFLASIRVPVRAVIGGKDEYISRPAEVGFALLGPALKSVPNFSSRVVNGANHVFDDHEAELASVLASWAGDAATQPKLKSQSPSGRDPTSFLA